MVKSRLIAGMTLEFPKKNIFKVKHWKWCSIQGWFWIIYLYQDSFQETQSDLEVILEFLEEYYKQNAGENGKRKAWRINCNT